MNESTIKVVEAEEHKFTVEIEADHEALMAALGGILETLYLSTLQKEELQKYLIEMVGVAKENAEMRSRANELS